MVTCSVAKVVIGGVVLCGVIAGTSQCGCFISWRFSLGCQNACTTWASRPSFPTYSPMRNWWEATAFCVALTIVRKTPVFRTLLGLGVTVNIATSMSVAVESAFAVVTLEATALQLGFVFGIGSVGGIIAGVLATPFVKKFGLWRSLRLAIIVFCPWAFLLPLAQPGWWVLLIGIGNAVVTFGLTVVTIASATIRQRTVDADTQGRVASTFRWIAGGVVPIGSIMGTLLNGLIGTRLTLVVCAVLLCCGVAWVARTEILPAA